LKLRDVNNVPLTVDGVDGEVQIDCTPPVMQAIVEAQGECYKAAPTFSIFRFRDDVNLDLADYQIDADGWNAIFPPPAVDDTVYFDDGWTLPGFGGLSEGSHTVYFRVKDDAGNWNGEGAPQPALYSWQFIKDTTPPAAPTGFVALPGHDKVHLTWTNPTGDGSFEGVEIRRVAWGDYPEYGTGAPVVPAPSYPADETEGDLVTQTGLEAYEDDPRTPRDIYYYAAFSYDCAGNYSTAGPTARDRSTSYWLGDMIPAGVGDGQIILVDLAAFSLTFGQIEDGPPWNAEGDIGPTDDYSRFGIPEPDDVVDFEDLMILAMNFQNVSPLGTSGGLIALAPPEKPLSEAVSFRLVVLSRDEPLVTYAVVIDNEAEVLKGFSLELAYGLANELVEVRPSSGLTGKGSEHFFGTIEREPGTVEVCVAALGVDAPFGYTGEVARVVVREGTSGGLSLGKADLRDLSNRREEIAGGETPETPFVPMSSALLQNHPNPFNPVTTITYDVAVAGNVRVEIYDVSGRLVRTVVNGHKDVGRHETSWNGRDGQGNPVHTGVYFYRMSAPGYTSPAKKMLLLK